MVLSYLLGRSATGAGRESVGCLLLDHILGVGARAYINNSFGLLPVSRQAFGIWHGECHLQGASWGSHRPLLARRSARLILTLDVAAPGIMLAKPAGRWGNFVG